MVDFLKEKSKIFDIFKKLCKKLKNKKDVNIGKIIRIKSDYGKEFKNGVFSASKTLQQNDVVERKNRTLQEMARVMINSKKLSKRLCAKAINTTCYTIDKVYLLLSTNKTAYELWKGKKPNLSYFHVFGCTCFILNDREYLGKF